MAVPTLTFQQLLWQFSTNTGLQPDSTVGTVTLTNEVISRYCQFLNDSVLFSWRPDRERPEIIWPFTVQVASSVAVSAGSFLLSAIGDADWLRIWTADNRAYTVTPTAYPVGYTQDGTSVWPRSTVTPLFVYYRPARPTFTYVLVVPAQSYVVGQLVYDSQIALTGTTNSNTTVNMASTTGLRNGMLVTGPGIPASTTVASFVANTSATLSQAATSSLSSQTLYFGTGNAFKCITASLGSTINNTSNWTAQTLPDPLVKMALAKANAYRQNAFGSDPAKAHAEAEQLLAEEKARSLPANGPAGPWDSDWSAI